MVSAIVQKLQYVSTTNQARDKQQHHSPVPIDTYTAVYQHDRNACNFITFIAQHVQTI